MKLCDNVVFFHSLPFSQNFLNLKRGWLYIPGHTRWVWDCVFSVDGAYLITGTNLVISLVSVFLNIFWNWIYINGFPFERLLSHQYLDFLGDNNYVFLTSTMIWWLQCKKYLKHIYSIVVTCIAQNWILHFRGNVKYR